MQNLEYTHPVLLHPSIIPHLWPLTVFLSHVSRWLTPHANSNTCTDKYDHNAYIHLCICHRQLGVWISVLLMIKHVLSHLYTTSFRQTQILFLEHFASLRHLFSVCYSRKHFSYSMGKKGWIRLTLTNHEGCWSVSPTFKDVYFVSTHVLGIMKAQ